MTPNFDRRRRHPPPSSTRARFFHNVEQVQEAARATGLEVRYIPALGRLSFKEQVEAMAHTGILIAPHGAALTNAMFLPQHAVLLEIFPPLMKK